jgi:hypothetical protein
VGADSPGTKICQSVLVAARLRRVGANAKIKISVLGEPIAAEERGSPFVTVLAVRLRLPARSAGVALTAETSA